jgi:hypothetical protein
MGGLLRIDPLVLVFGLGSMGGIQRTLVLAIITLSGGGQAVGGELQAVGLG